MIPIGEHYVLLEAQADEIVGSAVLTRPVGIRVGGADILVAIDAHRQKHLLVPLADPRINGDHASQGVTLGPRVLRVGTKDVVYADLQCCVPSLGLVFERLVEDILQRLSSDDSSPLATCRRVLDEWRALLRAAGRGFSREAVIGLVGELEVLRLLAEHDPVAALDAWRGPTGTVHDFVRSGNAIEVKTTTSVDGNFVSISNVDQLDSALVDSLHLAVVHAREDPAGPTLNERVETLLEVGVPQLTLLKRVEAYGYVYGSGAEIDDRFAVRSVRAWAVDDAFPGLRRSLIGEDRLRGVSHIKYELALDSAPPRLSDDRFKLLVAEWATSA